MDGSKGKWTDNNTFKHERNTGFYLLNTYDGVEEVKVQKSRVSWQQKATNLSKLVVLKDFSGVGRYASHVCVVSVNVLHTKMGGLKKKKSIYILLADINTNKWLKNYVHWDTH